MPPNPPFIWRAAISWPGCDGQPGIEHRASAPDGPGSGWRSPARSARRGAPAGTACACRAAAARPRTGPASAPALRRQDRIRSQNGSRRAVSTAPASTSPCPFRYLVAECTTRSAPNSSGRVSTGVATVLSTATRDPGGVRELADGGQVGDLPHRVGRGLHPDEPGAARPDRGRHRGQVAGVGELDVQAPGEAELGQPLAHPPVQHPGDQHVVAGQQRLEHRGGRGHPRGEQRARARRAPSSAASSRSACSKVGLSARV